MKTRKLLCLALFFGACILNVSADVKPPVQDPFTYPAHGDYTFTSNWIYSHALGNYSSKVNPIEGALQLSVAQATVRDMAYWNGKLVFGSRNSVPAIIVMDAVTGAFEREMPVIAEGFAGTNPCNSICVDDAGNVLVANIATSTQFQVWKIDMATGIGTKVIDISNNPIVQGTRFDAIGVFGDVTTNASIWGVASSVIVDEVSMFRWVIKDGKVPANPDLILIDFTTGFNKATGMGTAPRVYPISNDKAYVFGSNVLPTLVQVAGDEDDGYTAVAIDGFYSLDSSTTGLVNHIDNVTDPGKPLILNGASTLNGFTRFKVGDEQFFALSISRHANYSSTDWPTTPNQAWRLYKFKDDNALIREAEILWTFPRDGMAQNTSECPACAVSSANNFFFGPVHAAVSGGKANIYVYSGEWGVASYTFKTPFDNSITNPFVTNLSVSGGNKAIEFKGDVASAQIFSVTGQLVAKSNGETVAANAGVYVVKATAINGTTVIKKVIVK